MEDLMGKWKKTETEFEMSVLDDRKGSKFSRIPPAVLDALGNPDHIKFEIVGKKVIVTAGEKK